MVLTTFAKRCVHASFMWSQYCLCRGSTYTGVLHSRSMVPRMIHQLTKDFLLQGLLEAECYTVDSWGITEVISSLTFLCHSKMKTADQLTAWFLK